MDTEFPLMMYAEDGRSMIVSSADAEASLSGFRREPFPVHQGEGIRAPDQVLAVQPSGIDDMALHIADTVIERLLERFDLEPKEAAPTVNDDIAKPRRGRPPKMRQAEVDTEVSASQALPATTTVTTKEA